MPRASDISICAMRNLLSGLCKETIIYIRENKQQETCDLTDVITLCSGHSICKLCPFMLSTSAKDLLQDGFVLLTVWVVASPFKLSHEGRISGCQVTTALLLCYLLHVLIFMLKYGLFFFSYRVWEGSREVFIIGLSSYFMM